MASRLSSATSLRTGRVAPPAATPVTPMPSGQRAHAAQRALSMQLSFVRGQANKAAATLAPLDVLRFSRSAEPLARALRALVAGESELKKALNPHVQALGKLADATPEQLPLLEIPFASLCAILQEARLPAEMNTGPSPALRRQFEGMIEDLNPFRTPLVEDAARGARSLIACYDRMGGRPGMTVGVGTMLAEEAKTLTTALARAPRKDGEDELGICFDARTSFTRVLSILIALRDRC